MKGIFVNTVMPLSTAVASASPPIMYSRAISFLSQHAAPS